MFVQVFSMKQEASVLQPEVAHAGRIKELKSLYPYYRYLYDHSVNARYTMTKISTTNAEQIYKDYFVPIKNEMLKILSHIKL